MLVTLVLRLKEGPPPGEIRPLTTGWRMEKLPGEGAGAGQVPGSSRDVRQGGGAELVIKNRLPSPLREDTALFLPPYATFQAFSVSMGETRIYQYGTLGPDRANRHLYLKWHMIPLGPGAGGQTVSIRFYSRHHRYIGLIGRAYLGPPTSLLSAMVLRDLDITVLACLMVIAGLAALVIFAADHASRRRPLAFFSAMALCAGAYIFTESRITQFYIPVTPLLSHLHYISFFGFSIAMAAFVESLLGPGFLKLTRRMWQILMLLLGTGFVLDLTGLVAWDASFDSGLWIVLVFLLPLGLHIGRTALAGRYEARILCTGFGVLLALGIIDIMAGLRVVILESPALFPWGLLFLLFSFLWVMVYTHERERREMERARRTEQEAITEERHRIAREIHDGLAQDLAMMNMKTGLWRHLLEKDAQKLHNEFSWFETLVSKSIRDVRRCIFALRPMDLEKFGFKAGVARLVEDFQTHHGITVSYESQGLDILPGRLEPVLYRITQEALNNIAKHARASRVDLLISGNQREKILDFSIRDNGRGFLLKELDSCYRDGHLGLRQIRERVEKEDGDFRLDTGPERGCTIEITMPLQPPNKPYSP